MNDKHKPFDELIAEVKACRACPRMNNSERVIGHASGPLDASIMFIGEAPGRLGADESQIPFHGDKSGHNFESLIDQVRLTRYDSFVTNAVLCNPRDEAGNNATPTGVEVRNCAHFLQRQIDLVSPSIVVTLGATALKACELIESHGLRLSESVRTSNKWYGRLLLPVYHPGQRAMVHRSFANQLADYQYVSETLGRLGKGRRRKATSRPNDCVTAVVDEITKEATTLSYFALHKLLFLIEARALECDGQRITNSYIVRQKDGPYCVDLHPSKLAAAFPDVQLVRRSGRLLIIRQLGIDLDEPDKSAGLTARARQIVRDVVGKYGKLSDPDLKRVVYLNRHMREVLREERSLHVNRFNAPLLHPSK